MDMTHISSWDKNFFPSYTPKDMLEMGVFEGKYLGNIKHRYPVSWFRNAKLSKVADITLNYYGVKSRLPLSDWKASGWISDYDPLGWFEWYCNYYNGRRCPDDQRQIKRWRSFVVRHGAQVINSDKNTRLRQKQALLQWAWNWEDNINSQQIKEKNLQYILGIKYKNV